MNGETDDADGGGTDRGELGEREDPTKVVIPREFLLGQLERQAKAHERLRDKYRGARARFAAGAGREALDELGDEVGDLIEVMSGTQRAIANTIIAEDDHPAAKT